MKAKFSPQNNVNVVFRGKKKKSNSLLGQAFRITGICSE